MFGADIDYSFFIIPWRQIQSAGRGVPPS